MNVKKLRSMVMGLACLLILIACGYYWVWYLKPELWPTIMPFDIAQPPSPEVVAWHVTADPVWYDTHLPLTGIAGDWDKNMRRYKDGNFHLPNTLVPPAPAAGVRLLVKIELKSLPSLSPQLPGGRQQIVVFPRLRCKIYRARPEDEHWHHVETLGRGDLQAFSKSGRYGGGFTFYFVDVPPEAGNWRYRVQLTGHELPFNEAEVRAPMVPMLALQAEVDGEDLLITWDAQASVPADLLATPPALFVQSSQLAQVRVPLKAGSCRVSRRPAGGERMHHVSVSIDGVFEQGAWSSRVGKTTTRRASLRRLGCQLTEVLDLPLLEERDGLAKNPLEVTMEYTTTSLETKGEPIPGIALKTNMKVGRGSPLVHSYPPSSNTMLRFTTPTRGHNSYPEWSLGAPVRIKCQLTSGPLGGREVTVSAVPTPVIMGVRAFGDTDSIHVSWDDVMYNAPDWVEGPYLVVSRSPALRETDGFDLSFYNEFEPVAVLPATESVYVDKMVEADTPYCYRVSIEGITRSVHWQENVGHYDVFHEHLLDHTYGKNEPVIAQCEPPRYIYVSMSSAGLHSMSLEVTCQMMKQALRVPWLVLLEREMAPALLDEQQLRHLSSGASSAGGGGVFTNFALIPRFWDDLTCYPTGFWLQDPLNQDSRRFFVLSAWDTDVESQAEVMYTNLQNALLECAPANRHWTQPALPTTAQERHRIAVLGWQPADQRVSQLVGSDACADLITLGLVEQDQFDVVSREQMRDIMKEHKISLEGELSTEQALQASRMLNADMILTGRYGATSKDLIALARLIDVKTAQVLAVEMLHSPLADLQPMGTPLIDTIATARVPVLPQSDQRLARWAELGRVLTSNDLEAIKTKAYLSSMDPRSLADLGLKQCKEGNPQTALDNFYMAYWKARKAGEDARQYVLYIDALLRSANRTTQLAVIWEEHVYYLEESGGSGLEDAKLTWVSCLLDTGATEQARELLATLSPNYYVGVCYERAGDAEAALRVWKQCIGTSSPAWGEIVRELRRAEGETRQDLLQGYIRGAPRKLPAQVLQAAAEIRDEAGLPPDLQLIIANSALALEDVDRAREICLRLADDHSDTVAGADACLLLCRLADLAGEKKIAADWARKAKKLDLEDDVGGRINQFADMYLDSGRTRRLNTHSLPAKREPDYGEIPQTDNTCMKRLFAEDETPLLVRRLPNGFLVMMKDGATEPPVVIKLKQHDVYDEQQSDEPLRTRLNGSVVGYGQAVIVATPEAGILEAFEREGGKTLWSFQAWEPISTPSVDEDDLLVSGSHGDLYVLDPLSGAVRQIEEPLLGLSVRAATDMEPTLSVHEGKANVGLNRESWRRNQGVFGGATFRKVAGRWQAVSGNRQDGPIWNGVPQHNEISIPWRMAKHSNKKEKARIGWLYGICPEYIDDVLLLSRCPWNQPPNRSMMYMLPYVSGRELHYVPEWEALLYAHPELFPEFRQ